MNFFNEIKKFDGLKFRDAEYNVKNNTLTATFLYNPNMFTLADNVVKIEEILKKSVKEDVNVETKFTKCVLDKNAIIMYCFTTITNNFPALNKDFALTDINVEIEDLNISVVLALKPKMLEYAKRTNRNEDIKNKLEENFYGNFKVMFQEKADITGEEIDVVASNLEFQNSIKLFNEKVVYKISNIQHIFGKGDYNLAIDFSKGTENLSECVVCGNITKIDKRTYKRKHTHNGETKEIDRYFYSITINNDGKFLSCSVFPSAHEEIRGDVIEVGKSIAIHGKFDTFNGRVNFSGNKLCFCDYERYVPPVPFKSVNENYHTIFPEEYVDYSQSDMFALDSEEELKEKDKSFVVFDFETTGLDAKTCEIIEIGAVKISGGKIVSTFSCFIKPSTPIPQEITDLTSITNKMVEDSPAINYVLPDFYKYCYGCGLVAHNISFDYGFLSAIAKKMNYNFDNPQFDTLAMARQKLLGLKNFKLETVAERLGVSLVGAHRAVNDAMATAKVFLKLL